MNLCQVDRFMPGILFFIYVYGRISVIGSVEKVF